MRESIALPLTVLCVCVDCVRSKCKWSYQHILMLKILSSCWWVNPPWCLYQQFTEWAYEFIEWFSCMVYVQLRSVTNFIIVNERKRKTIGKMANIFSSIPPSHSFLLYLSSSLSIQILILNMSKHSVSMRKLKSTG